MTKDELEIGRLYSCGGEPVYKLEDFGTDWVLVLHYSTVHYVANPDVLRMEEFLRDFHEEENDYYGDVFTDDLVYYHESMLVHKERN